MYCSSAVWGGYFCIFYLINDEHPRYTSTQHNHSSLVLQFFIVIIIRNYILYIHIFISLCRYLFIVLISSAYVDILCILSHHKLIQASRREDKDVDFMQSTAFLIIDRIFHFGYKQLKIVIECYGYCKRKRDKWNKVTHRIYKIYVLIVLCFMFTVNLLLFI